jgi:hypothetical protein
LRWINGAALCTRVPCPHTDQLADTVDTLGGKCALAGKVTHLPVAGILCTTRPPGDGGLWPSDRAAVAAKLCFD